jgi:Fe-S-cluster-containing hydrogenase component 2
MSDFDHVQACAQARLNGLKGFFLARGHEADEASDFAAKHLAGETVPINCPNCKTRPCVCEVPALPQADGDAT